MQHSQTLDTSQYTKKQWVEHFWVSQKIEDYELLSYAVELALKQASIRVLQKEPTSLQVADILCSIQVDQAMLIAALLSDADIALPSSEEVSPITASIASIGADCALRI